MTCLTDQGDTVINPDVQELINYLSKSANELDHVIGEIVNKSQEIV